MPSRPETKYSLELRTFSIEMIQNRNYTLVDRLVILVLFYEELENLTARGEIDAIPSQNRVFEEGIRKGLYTERIAAFPSGIVTQCELYGGYLPSFVHRHKQ